MKPKTTGHISETQVREDLRDELARNLLGEQNHSLVAWLQKSSRVARQYQALGKVILSDESADMPVKPGALPGDPKALRGIPAVGGRGSMGGAIYGSRPGDSLSGPRGEDALREIRRRAKIRDGGPAPDQEPPDDGDG